MSFSVASLAAVAAVATKVTALRADAADTCEVMQVNLRMPDGSVYVFAWDSELADWAVTTKESAVTTL